MRSLAAILLVGLFACGGGGADKPEAASIEKALSHVVEGQEKTKAAVDTKAVVKMKEKAAEEAAAAYQATFDALIVVPPDGAGKLAENCEAAAAAYDAFKSSRLSGDAGARWAAVKEPDLNKITEKCKASKNAEAAACKAHALQSAPATFAETAGDKILAACEDKFGKKEG